MKKLIDKIFWEEVAEGVWFLRPFWQKIHNLFSKKTVYDPDGLPF